MYITPIELDPEIGFQPANWRLELAKLVARDAVPPLLRRLVDDLVRQTASVIAGHPDPDIQAAIDLHYNGPVIDRSEITARILADQTADEIAAAVGRSKAVIKLFERLAFDVRGRRPRPPGIPGLALMEPIDEDDVEAVLNRVAVQGGLDAVEAVVKYFRPKRRRVNAPESASDVNGRRQVARGIYQKLIRLCIEPVDLLGIVQAMRQEAAAGVPQPWDKPVPSDASAEV